MDNRINEIRRKMSVLRAEMVRVEDVMHDQIKHDLDCTESALRLMAMRAELAALVAEWKAAGGSEPLPTIQERLKVNNRPAQKPKASISR
jgi:chorismate mutase